MADNNKKNYASLDTLKTFLDNLKTLFAAKIDLDDAIEQLDSKADIEDVNNLQTSLNEATQSMTDEEIDSICGTSIALSSEVEF